MSGVKVTWVRRDARVCLKNVSKNFRKHLGDAAYAEMDIETQEVRNRTPVKTGDLLSTVKLIGPIEDGNKIILIIIAGGPKAPYALIVHEDLEAFHKVGQAKYIESVLMESRPYLGARIAKRINLADMID